MRDKILYSVFAVLVILTLALSIGWSSKPAIANSLGGLYAGGSNPGIVYHYNGDNNWDPISPELGYAVLSLVEYEGHLYAGTTSAFGSGGVGRVYRYEGGNTWTLVGDNLDNEVCALAVYQGDLYAGTAWQGMKLYRYEDGTNWTQVIGQVIWSGTRSLYISHDYLLMGDILYDRFGRWDGSSFYADLSGGGSCIYNYQDYGDYVYAAAYLGRLWRSTDAINWSVMLGYYDGNMWELEEFQDKLYMSYNNGELRAYDGTGYLRGELVYRAPDGIISMTTNGDNLYFGTGGDAVGYGPESTGIANVYRYDGTEVTLISDEDEFGAGVQYLFYLPPSLLQKYSPVLYMYTYPEEQFYPWGIYSMLNKAELWEWMIFMGWKVLDMPIYLDNLSDPSYNDELFYLNLKDYTPYFNPPSYTEWQNYEIVIYGRQYEPPGHPNRIVLQYWFFYPFNKWINHHEGDWEMVQIVLDKETKDPVWLTCAHHHGGTTYDWHEVSVIEETQHPKIFIGKGSHSSWGTNGTHKIGCFTDETSENGMALYPQDVGPSAIKGTEDQRPYTLNDISSDPNWAYWLGEWGEKFLGSPGPKSPAQQVKNDINVWGDPIGWTHDPSPPWYTAIASSPVNLHAYDPYGNHVGLTETGEIETNVPSTYFYVPSFYADNQKELMWINSSEGLRFVIEAIAEGEFNFIFNRYLKEKDKTIGATYEDIRITEDTVATVDVSPENPELVMEIDSDGDNTIDEYQKPSSYSEDGITWTDLFTDLKRGTKLFINTDNKTFQFTAPDFDTGVIETPDMRIIEVDPLEPSKELKYNPKKKTWKIDLSKLDLPPSVEDLVSRYEFEEKPEEIILIPYRDENINFFAVAVDSNKDFCAAHLLHKAGRKIYLLIDKPGIEGPE